MQMKIITVSREFGSGGRELGKRLAEAMGLRYYDREIISELAKREKLDEDYVESLVEQGFASGFQYTFRRSFSAMPPKTPRSAQYLAEQHKIIRTLAEKGDCLFVGRSSDAVLSELEPLRIFVHAEPWAKLKRCRERAAEDEKLSERTLISKMKQIDKARADCHDVIAPFPWGDRRGYELCVNTTGIEIKEMIPVLAEYAVRWFDREKK